MKWGVPMQQPLCDFLHIEKEDDDFFETESKICRYNNVLFEISIHFYLIIMTGLDFIIIHEQEVDA